MLWRLLKQGLTPYRPWLWVIVVLQFTGTMASLFLPSLNADIIDNGVAKGDTAYIWHTGLIMLGVSLVQITCSTVSILERAGDARDADTAMLAWSSSSSRVRRRCSDS